MKFLNTLKKKCRESFPYELFKPLYENILETFSNEIIKIFQVKRQQNFPI